MENIIFIAIILSSLVLLISCFVTVFGKDRRILTPLPEKIPVQPFDVSDTN